MQRKAYSDYISVSQTRATAVEPSRVIANIFSLAVEHVLLIPDDTELVLDEIIGQNQTIFPQPAKHCSKLCGFGGAQVQNQ